ncbi:MAG TPA: HlyD family efflux transporter periplasmic adaptor subunit [Kofleriaceae bacterium]|jgi:membrane fusion protein (multidrug efflux system)|nr:HlyD family efflux transporter periplasmic adaptor subunit [Kofleriaceae bacterium]
MTAHARAQPPAQTMIMTRVEAPAFDPEIAERTAVEIMEQTVINAPVLAERPGPLAIALAPAIEREVFQLARRVALQADLTAAMRALRDGVARLTNSTDANCVFFDPALCSAWTALDAERDIDVSARQLVADVARAGRRAVFERAVLEPFAAGPARAVLMVCRAAGSASYGSVEVAIVAAVAAAVAGLIGHFVAEHAARRDQELRDARSPFRPEALAERRTALAAPGRLVTTPRTWIRWAYPTLLGVVIAVLAAAALVEVPTYSTGFAIVTAEGEHVTSPAPGTVAAVLVAPGTRVELDQPVLRLRAPAEDSELEAADTAYGNALGAFLTTPGDDNARNALVAITNRRQLARKAVDDHVLRATASGVVGDIRVRAGQLVTPGAPLMKISASTDLVVVGVFPGPDRPRLETGMTLQIELPGFHKKREEATIDAIGSQVIGPDEARRSLGDPIGDALPISGPVVIVHAHLPAHTFEASGRAYEFHDGMLGKAEVRVDEESLLRALLPKGD